MRTQAGRAGSDGGDGAAAMRAFVFGAGYSGGAFLRLVGKERVAGASVRSEAGAQSLRDEGFPAFAFDGERAQGPDDPAIRAALAEATHLLVCAPPGHESEPGVRAGGANAAPGDPVLRRFGAAIETGMPRLAWIGYLSTVGVYGDHRGAAVDEASALNAEAPRARERLAAEAAWRAQGVRLGVPVAILRLSGIYGPGRNALKNLAEGTARRVVKPGQVFNRIHVADIAGAALHLAARRIGGVFNVTDDEPAPPQDVVLFAARLAGLEPPPETPFEPETMSAMARSFWGDNKRVSNAALKAAGYRLAFPTYREGLSAIAAGGGSQASSRPGDVP